MRILVLSTTHFGDVLLTTPALRALKKGLDEPWVACVVGREASEVLRGNPHVDELITYSSEVSLWERARLARKVREIAPDVAVVLSRSSWWMSLLALLSGAKFRAGFDGLPFLTHKVPWERGKHRILRYLSLAEAVGARSEGVHLEIFPDACDVDEVLEKVLKFAGL